MLKKIIITLTIIIALLALSATGGYYWLKSLIPEKINTDVTTTTADQLTYLDRRVTEQRGRILAVVTSADKMGSSDKTTGYELTELARAYWVFTANGFEVDFASPQGGHPPVVLDDDDMGPYDYAFLNDTEIQTRMRHTLPIDSVNADRYDAVYFVGGKGAMFDFPENKAIQTLVKTMYQDSKIITAVCHGPAALVNVKLDNGKWLVADQNVSGFTNEEELFLIPDAQQIFPFLLQDKLTQRGARFSAGQQYLENIAVNQQLITGQNPWSVWAMAEKTIQSLGYTPITRNRTSEENSVDLLITYHQHGMDSAEQLVENATTQFQTTLILVHGIVAFMKFEIGVGLDMMTLAEAVKHKSTL